MTRCTKTCFLFCLVLPFRLLCLSLEKKKAEEIETPAVVWCGCLCSHFTIDWAPSGHQLFLVRFFLLRVQQTGSLRFPPNQGKDKLWRQSVAAVKGGRRNFRSFSWLMSFQNLEPLKPKKKKKKCYLLICDGQCLRKSFWSVEIIIKKYILQVKVEHILPCLNPFVFLFFGSKQC